VPLLTFIHTYLVEALTGSFSVRGVPATVEHRARQTYQLEAVSRKFLIQRSSRTNINRIPAPPTAPGTVAAISFVTGWHARTAIADNGVPTASLFVEFDTTNANLIVAIISAMEGPTPGACRYTPQDSLGNTWVPVHFVTRADTGHYQAWFMAYGPNLHVGWAHRFQVTPLCTGYPALMVMALRSTITPTASPVLDRSGRAGDANTWIQPAPIAGGVFAMSAMLIQTTMASGAPTIDSGFTRQGQLAWGGTGMSGMGFGYGYRANPPALIQPTWSITQMTWTSLAGNLSLHIESAGAAGGGDHQNVGSSMGDSPIFGGSMG
jgi:hypothetical protein